MVTIANLMENLFPKRMQNLVIYAKTEPQILTENPRKSYVIRNMNENKIAFLGGPNVTPETGFPLLPGEVLYLNTAADIYAVAEDETEAVELRVIVLY